jgi:hypothetical protein
VVEADLPIVEVALTLVLDVEHRRTTVVLRLLK